MNSQNLYYPNGSNRNIGMYGAPPESNEEKLTRLIAEIGDTDSNPTKIEKYKEIISVSQAAIQSLSQNGGKRRKTKKNKKTRSK